MRRPKASVWRERKRRSPKQSIRLTNPEVTRQESVKGKRQMKYQQEKPTKGKKCMEKMFLRVADVIQAYLGGGMDMNRANEARDMTKRLGALAEKYKCAIVLIGHMNKAGGTKAAYRGIGSIDFYLQLSF